MLALRDVNLFYDNVHVLTDVSLDVAAGQIVALLGPNGVGKSTVINVASGELPPADGEVLLNEKPLSSLPLQEKAQRMAVLPQQSSLQFAFLARDVVKMGRMPHATGVVMDSEIVEQALAATDCQFLADRPYTQLSGGERQRVQLARVLAQVWQHSDDAAATVLLLDEPTSALDYLHQTMVIDALRSAAARGCGILMAVHDLNLAAACATHLVLMQCGRIRAQGAVDEVFDPPLLKDVFGIDFHRITHPHTGLPWLLT